ncbi:putative Translation initiation factor IF-2 [Quillaja saponaria]|uniref:Translation initiation factor IF-2 n=1 Tax=Quillaja saponaria TaxID=32244 RepID=A0AAD7M6W4_QUISA|nr:putative Translation initiation factor IF-2 [Quillaja saponaria]
MFEYTLEMITRAASNSHFIFCFCNLIIVIIFVGSKHRFNTDQEGEIPTSTVDKVRRNEKQGTNAKHLFDENKQFQSAAEVSNGQEAPADNNLETGDSDTCSYDEEEEEDELRKRVEEFIDKVNRGWKAELLRTSGFV